MDDATLTALQQSIEKWEKRAAGDHDGKLGVAYCPLCFLFFQGGACSGCPVSEKTGENLCDNSPYSDYCKESTNLTAKAELDFLKSLLPAEEVSEKAKFNWTDLGYLG